MNRPAALVLIRAISTSNPINEISQRKFLLTLWLVGVLCSNSLAEAVVFNLIKNDSSPLFFRVYMRSI